MHSALFYRLLFCRLFYRCAELGVTVLSVTPFYLFQSGFLATAAAAVNIAGSGWEEIIGRELNFTENVTRTVGRIVTLLFGYAEIIYRH